MPWTNWAMREICWSANDPRSGVLFRLRQSDCASTMEAYRPFCANNSSCVPCSTICPPSIATMRSAMRAEPMRWMTITAATFRATAANFRYTCASSNGSMAPVGSSSTMMSCPRYSPLATANRCHCPPEMSTPSISRDSTVSIP